MPVRRSLRARRATRSCWVRVSVSVATIAPPRGVLALFLATELRGRVSRAPGMDPPDVLGEMLHGRVDPAFGAGERLGVRPIHHAATSAHAPGESNPSAADHRPGVRGACHRAPYRDR